MGIAVYSIKRLGDQWAVEHDGKIEGDDYISKESAFEAIIGAASLSIRDGHDVTIKIPGKADDEALLGAKSN